jgi:hypothetical protein
VLTYISENEAADLYSTRRARVQEVISSKFQAALADISTNVPLEEAYIKLEDVLIEEIDLPPFVRAAIEEKEKVRHMSEAYEFRLQLEAKERDRKRIEAEGIRAFQEIVAPGITSSYLRWRGIEATLELAKSNNAKVVIIGNKSDGLPVILNMDGLKDADKADDRPGPRPTAGEPARPGPRVPSPGKTAPPGGPAPGDLRGTPADPGTPGTVQAPTKPGPAPRPEGAGPVAPDPLSPPGTQTASMPRAQPGDTAAP